MERVGDKRRRIAPDDLGEKGLERQTERRYTERNRPSVPIPDPAKLNAKIQKIRDELAPMMEKIRKERDTNKTSE